MTTCRSSDRRRTSRLDQRVRILRPRRDAGTPLRPGLRRTDHRRRRHQRGRVELQLGAYLPLFPPSGLADLNDALLPTLSGDRILLDNRDWEMPTEQNVDVFVNRLVRAGLLIFDPLVDEIRHGERPRAMSERTAQIRFRRAVGISRRKLVSIEQAQHAAQLLTAGESIADVVTVGGYYDQPQLARAMRWATGHTPGELRSGIPFVAF